MPPVRGIINTVNLMGDSKDMHCTLIGRKVEGEWMRTIAEGSGVNMSALNINDVVVLLRDMETQNLIPVHVTPMKYRDDKVSLSLSLSLPPSLSLSSSPEPTAASPHRVDRTPEKRSDKTKFS